MRAVFGRWCLPSVPATLLHPRCICCGTPTTPAQPWCAACRAAPYRHAPSATVVLCGGFEYERLASTLAMVWDGDWDRALPPADHRLGSYVMDAIGVGAEAVVFLRFAPALTPWHFGQVVNEVIERGLSAIEGL